MNLTPYFFMSLSLCPYVLMSLCPYVLCPVFCPYVFCSLSLSYVERSPFFAFARTIVITGLAAVIVAVVVYFLAREGRRWWRQRKRRKASKDLAAYEDPVYLQQLELEMIRRRRERMERGNGREGGREGNIYEEI